jgi:biotin transport system permease protein
VAARLTFHYFPGDTCLHRWDARCKLLGMAILAVGILHMGEEALAAFSIAWAVALRFSRVPAKALVRDLKVWGIFLGLIFLIQALSSPTDWTAISSGLPAAARTLEPAVLACWRLGLILCYSVLFTFVTRPREVQDAVVWYLKPFPFLPARRLALMISLTIRFLPLILDQAEEVRAAEKSRLGELRKNPFLRVKYFILPVFRRSLIRADGLAVSLAARGYREDLPVDLPGIPRHHAGSLIALGLLVFFASGALGDVAGFSQTAVQKVTALLSHPRIE